MQLPALRARNMIYYIYHWYGKVPPVPEATKRTFIRSTQVGTKKQPKRLHSEVEGYAVDVSDLHEFAKTHGPIQLVPPTTNFPHWSIYVTDETRKWGQK
jgi:hypothetical protein